MSETRAQYEVRGESRIIPQPDPTRSIAWFNQAIDISVEMRAIARCVIQGAAGGASYAAACQRLEVCAARSRNLADDMTRAMLALSQGGAA